MEPRQPELLDLIAYDLAARLAELVPDWSELDRVGLANDLTDQCRARIGGNWLVSKPHVAAMDLSATDPAYAVVSELWLATLSRRIKQPEGWLKVATAQLVDTLRRTAGGQYLPKGITTSPDRDEQIYRAFRGSFRDVALQFGISAERVRQIIIPRINAERAGRQRDLFGG